MTRLTFAAAASAALLAACGGSKTALPGASGKVRFSARSIGAIPGPAAAPSVCSTFTLQPYSLDASGTSTLAGSPVTIASTGAASATAAILGCIDSLPGNDWGYLVTASGFVDCASGLAIPGLSPSVVTGNFPVNCVAGQDVPLSVSVNVSIPVADSAGYIDIAVAVDTSQVQTGCKQADLGLGGLLHFGESYVDPTGDPAGGPMAAHDGLLGLDHGTPAQFGGIVSGGQPAQDTWYTGKIDPGASSPATSLLFQTFVDRCGAAEYADDRHAQCVTDLSSGAPVTSASLADVFLGDPAFGYVSASITPAGAIQLYSGVAALSIMTATPAVSLGNNGLAAQSIAAPAGYTFTGLFIDHSTADQLLVTGVSAPGGVPVYWTLAYAAPLWALAAAPTPIASVSAAQLQCLGLFAADSNACVTPKSCLVLPKAMGAEQCSIALDNTSVYYADKSQCSLYDFSAATQAAYCSEYWVCDAAYKTYLLAWATANQSCSARPITDCTVTGPSAGDCSCNFPVVH